MFADGEGRHPYFGSDLKNNSEGTEGQNEPVNPTEGQNFMTNGEGQDHREVPVDPGQGRPEFVEGDEYTVTEEEKNRLSQVAQRMIEAGQIKSASDENVRFLIGEAFNDGEEPSAEDMAKYSKDANLALRFHGQWEPYHTGQ